MPRFSKAEIFAANKPDVEPIDIPEWGGQFNVKVMSGRERDAFEGRWARSPYDNLRAFLVVLTLVDDVGEHVFELVDLEKVGKLPSPTLDRVFAKALEVNRLSKRDVDALEKKS